MNNNPSAPPSYDPPPKYEDIFGEGPSNEIVVEIPTQNEDQQIQVQMVQRAPMVQVTIGRQMPHSELKFQKKTIFKSKKSNFFTFSKVQKHIFCYFKNGKKKISTKKSLKL